MARYNPDGSPSGRPSTDVFGNSFVGTHEQVLASNDEVNRRFSLGKYAASEGGGYGKQRAGKQSRGEMDLTKGKKSSILTDKSYG